MLFSVWLIYDLIFPLTETSGDMRGRRGDGEAALECIQQLVAVDGRGSDGLGLHEPGKCWRGRNWDSDEIAMWKY